MSLMTLPLALPYFPTTPFVPGATQSYSVFIGGQAVNVIAGSLDLTDQLGQRSTGSVQVWTALGVKWLYGTRVLVYNASGTLVYAGFTTQDKLTKGSRQGQGVLEHSIQLMDNCYKADKLSVFTSYLNQSAGSIVNDLLGKKLAAEGVTTLPGSIAKGANIVEVVWNGKQVSKALDWLATQSGYWWKIDLNGVLWFQPYTGIAAPFTIDGTQVDTSFGNLSVTYGNDMYVNRQYAKGAYAQTGYKTETFHGDGVRRNFTLSYEISSSSQHDNTILVNGVAQSYDAKGQNGAQWYIAVGDAVVAQDPANTVLGSGDTLSVTYKGRYPVVAMAQNPTLIAAQKAREGVGGSGIVENVYANSKVHSVAAAFQIASALLAHYGQDAILLEFDTQQTGFQAGQSVLVNLPDFALTNTQMLVQSVELTDQLDDQTIWWRIKAIGSPLELAAWTTYWQNLMNQSADPSDLSDTADTSLALLSSSTLARTPTATVTQNKAVGAICGVGGSSPPGMICGQWTVC